jgi:hypothetical protein
MRRAGRDQHRVAGADLQRGIAQGHDAGTGSDVIQLFGQRVSMELRPRAGLDGGLGQALQPDASVRGLWIRPW